MQLNITHGFRSNTEQNAAKILGIMVGLIFLLLLIMILTPLSLFVPHYFPKKDDFARTRPWFQNNRTFTSAPFPSKPFIR